MKEEFAERLRRLLGLVASGRSESEKISQIRKEIKDLKDEFSEKTGFLNDLYQTVIAADEKSLKLLKILIESELLKQKKENTEKPKENNPAGDILSKPIQFVKGVGPVLFEKFSRKGITTIRDALFFFPRDYEDRRRIIPIGHIPPGETVTVTGKVIGSKETRKTYTMTIADRSGFLDLVWFNIQPHYRNYLEERFKTDTNVIVSGKANLYKRTIQINHPVIKETSSVDDDLFFRRIIPVYSAIEGIGESLLIKIMKNIVDEYAEYLTDPLPEYLLKKHNLIPLPRAIKEIHFPLPEVDFGILQSNRWEPRRRIIFDELFSLEITLALRKSRFQDETGYAHKIEDSSVKEAVNHLPFKLTPSQNTALNEIINDLRSSQQMNRILIGDVGSGKTAVAMITSYLVAQSGTQTAILAPTEILAKQHYRNFCNIFPSFQSRIGLLTGSVKGPERSRILGDIEMGLTKIVIGTHALLEENISFRNLTFVIVDEQHQFGINQRARIKAKGLNPDLLMMSATPIPRTLAISLYGDLDISIIKELPPGRQEITTHVIRGEKADRLYIELREQILKNDAQCYIVYPIISESEKLDLKAAEEMYDKLKNTVFRDIPVGLLHGRMKDDEKTDIMNEFKSGRLKILIATTVIEVGVDVPAASIMVIEHAERFGLSQLHQLRGRVGRGSKKSFCYLIAYNWLSENAFERLRIMEKTNSGFKIAEEDLRIRGPGELAGTKQSGLPDLHMSNLIRDADILEEARNSAFEIIKTDPNLQEEKNNILWSLIKKRERELELITTS